jgi:peptide deformylase
LPVSLQQFFFVRHLRYPDRTGAAHGVAQSVITPRCDEEEDGWLFVGAGLRGVVPRFSRIRYTGFHPQWWSRIRTAR